jgi:hypothetical protein
MLVDRRPAWLLAGLLLVAACGGDGGADSDESAATTTSASERRPTSTSTAVPPVDPSVIPEDPAAIDEAYVEAVLEEHNRVIGDALRLQLQGAELEEIVDRYNAIYVPDVADAELTDTLQLSAEEASRYKSPPGNTTSDVVELFEVTPTCIAVLWCRALKVWWSIHPTRSQLRSSYVWADPSERSELNPTAWLSEGLTLPESEGFRSCDAR